MGGVYVHVPYCRHKCGYCAFNSRPLRRAGELAAYLAAIHAEIRLREGELRALPVETVYFGGGTPSVADPDALGTLLRRILDVAAPARAPAEVTVEANPEGLDEARLDRLRSAGFDRLSLGVQSFDAAALRYLERQHAPDAVPRIVSAARRVGFDNLTLDLIVGLPAPLEGTHERDVPRVVALAPEHVSVYLLGIEEPSRLAQAVAEGRAVVPAEGHQADAFLATHALLAAAGYEHYEVSSFALPGRRARHNGAYWSGAPYVGLGAGAHSFLVVGGQAIRRSNTADPEAYARALAEGRAPVDFEEVVTPEMALQERIMLAVRTRDGLSLADCGSAAAPLREALEKMAGRGLLERDGDRYRPTPEGLLHADGVAVTLWEALDG